MCCGIVDIEMRIVMTAQEKNLLILWLLEIENCSPVETSRRILTLECAFHVVETGNGQIKTEEKDGLEL